MKESGEININHQVWVKKLLPTLLQEKRMEWEKTIERSNRRRINIDCLAQVGIRHPGAKLTTLGREPRAEKNRKKINQIIPWHKSHSFVSSNSNSCLNSFKKWGWEKNCFISLSHKREQRKWSLRIYKDILSRPEKMQTIVWMGLTSSVFTHHGILDEPP